MLRYFVAVLLLGSSSGFHVSFKRTEAPKIQMSTQKPPPNYGFGKRIRATGAKIASSSSAQAARPTESKPKPTSDLTSQEIKDPEPNVPPIKRALRTALVPDPEPVATPSNTREVSAPIASPVPSSYVPISEFKSDREAETNTELKPSSQTDLFEDVDNDDYVPAPTSSYRYASTTQPAAAKEEVESGSIIDTDLFEGVNGIGDVDSVNSVDDRTAPAGSDYMYQSTPQPELEPESSSEPDLFKGIDVSNDVDGSSYKYPPTSNQELEPAPEPVAEVDDDVDKAKSAPMLDSGGGVSPAARRTFGNSAKGKAPSATTASSDPRKRGRAYSPITPAPTATTTSVASSADDGAAVAFSVPPAEDAIAELSIEAAGVVFVEEKPDTVPPTTNTESLSSSSSSSSSSTWIEPSVTEASIMDSTPSSVTWEEPSPASTGRVGEPSLVDESSADNSMGGSPSSWEETPEAPEAATATMEETPEVTISTIEEAPEAATTAMEEEQEAPETLETVATAAMEEEQETPETLETVATATMDAPSSVYNTSVDVNTGVQDESTAVQVMPNVDAVEDIYETLEETAMREMDVEEEQQIIDVEEKEEEGEKEEEEEEEEEGPPLLSDNDDDDDESIDIESLLMESAVDEESLIDADTQLKEQVEQEAKLRRARSDELSKFKSQLSQSIARSEEVESIISSELETLRSAATAEIASEGQRLDQLKALYDSFTDAFVAKTSVLQSEEAVLQQMREVRDKVTQQAVLKQLDEAMEKKSALVKIEQGICSDISTCGEDINAEISFTNSKIFFLTESLASLPDLKDREAVRSFSWAKIEALEARIMETIKAEQERENRILALESSLQDVMNRRGIVLGENTRLPPMVASNMEEILGAEEEERKSLENIDTDRKEEDEDSSSSFSVAVAVATRMDEEDTKGMSREQLSELLKSRNDAELKSTAVEALKRTLKSLASTTVGLAEVSTKVLVSDEADEAKVALGEAATSLKELGVGVKDAWTAVRGTWKKEVGTSLDKAASTEEYINNVFSGLKKVLSTEEVQSALVTVSSKSLSTGIGFGKATLSTTSKIASEANISNRFRQSLDELSASISVLLTVLQTSVERYVEGQIDRQLPPTKESKLTNDSMESKETNDSIESKESEE